MASTLTEKIYARTAGLDEVRAGMGVTVRPDHALAYDFPGYSDKLLSALSDLAGRPALHPGHRVMFIDHLTTRSSPRIDAIHGQTRDGAQQFGYDLHEGKGIGHQVACEIGLAEPGAMLVHFDPHVAAAGAYGALALGVGYSYTGIWATGQWNTRVPRAVALELLGELGRGVDSRDLLHELVRRFAGSSLAGAVLEISGPGAASLGREQLQGLCAMAIFTGALSAVYLDPLSPVQPDPDATYAQRLALDLSQVQPLIVLPGSARPDHIRHMPEADVPVTRAFVGSCVSGRLQDLRSVARVVLGRKVAAGVRFLVSPVSIAIRQQADREGITECLTAAGVEVLDSSCDCCYGFAEPLAAGDTCISSGTLNIEGRMGSSAARIFLASPASVAAAAICGRIIDPRLLLENTA